MRPPDECGPLPLLPGPDERGKLRKRMGITIIDAAAELKVSRTSYSLWERGLRTPAPGHFRAYHAQLSRWQEAVDGVQ